MSGKEKSLKLQTFSGMIWKSAERISAQLVSFVVSVILARLLLPETYGIIALVTVFISLCDEFVSGGFATSLIQKRDADNIDFSSVLYFSLFVSAVFYAFLFFCAPLIASFYSKYDGKLLIAVIRVMGLRVIISAINSVQHAYVTRTMQFRRFFWSTLLGALISAVIGIGMAYTGYGVWALVAQYCSMALADTVILWFTVRWRPQLVYSWERMRDLFSYGWKIFAASMIRTLYNDLRSLIIGKLYTSEDLAYYNKGQSFPQLVSSNTFGAINSVLFSVLSKCQSDAASVRAILRRSIIEGTYIVFPFMIGLAIVGRPLILLLLTEKWEPCVIYLQICCISFAFTPIESSNLQAIKAVGKSALALKLEIIKKILGVMILLFSMKFGMTAIAVSLVINTILSAFINAVPNKKLFDYSFSRQFLDIVPNILLSAAMAAAVWPISLLNLGPLPMLALQGAAGVIVYFLLSILFKVESFYYLLGTVREMLFKKEHKSNGNEI